VWLYAGQQRSVVTISLQFTRRGGPAVTLSLSF
jgi:hypothetical protein